MQKRLPDNCLLLYSDLLQKTIDSSYALLGGGAFVSKEIAGIRYWYFQTKSKEGTKQKYIGKQSDDLLKNIGRAKASRESMQKIIGERRRLIAMLGAGGSFIEKGRPVKILSKMADAGLFSSGGVLVGSFAYACYGNMLGYLLDSNIARTEDMDFSVERNFEIGIERPLLNEITSFEPSFRIPFQTNPSAPPFEMIAADGFKIEFLTTKTDSADKSPVFIDRFSLYAHPLDFMDYLIQKPQPAVILAGSGIPVLVPDPARFALHKLAISRLRPIGFQTKINKDIAQAQSILEILVDDNPGALLMAFDILRQRGDFLLSHVNSGIDRLPSNVRGAILDVVGNHAAEWDADRGAMKNS